MVNVYMDGVFDLFHQGHLDSIQSCADMGNVIIGVVSDKNAESYKRQPIICEKHRYNMIRSLTLVDKVVEDAPMFVTEDFIQEHKIDVVVHGFADKDDYDKQKDYFKIPIDLGIFKQIEYSVENNTTKIIKKIQHLNT